MRVISYSIFNDRQYPFEFAFYLRGIYWNARMNRLIYPDWQTVVHVEPLVYKKYTDYFVGLEEKLKISTHLMDKKAPRCEMMLWRMKALFTPSSEYVICRDADAITTYREAQSVHRWLESGKSAHMILDNPAHGGMMGGMVGFKANAIRGHFNSFNALIEGMDLSKHGSDQHLMNLRIYPHIKDDVYLDNNPQGLTSPAFADLPGVDKRLWESNLTCRHIGSPGVVEMELLRFFKRHDPTNYDKFEKEFSGVFYWQQ